MTTWATRPTAAASAIRRNLYKRAWRRLPGIACKGIRISTKYLTAAKRRQRFAGVTANAVIMIPYHMGGWASHSPGPAPTTYLQPATCSTAPPPVPPPTTATAPATCTTCHHHTTLPAHHCTTCTPLHTIHTTLHHCTLTTHALGFHHHTTPPPVPLSHAHACLPYALGSCLLGLRHLYCTPELCTTGSHYLFWITQEHRIFLTTARTPRTRAPAASRTAHSNLLSAFTHYQLPAHAVFHHTCTRCCTTAHLFRTTHLHCHCSTAPHLPFPLLPTHMPPAPITCRKAVRHA